MCSLRALYGVDVRYNAVHGSSGCEEAGRKIRLFFHDSQFSTDTYLLIRSICLFNCWKK